MKGAHSGLFASLAVLLTAGAHAAWTVQQATEGEIDKFIPADLRSDGVQRIYGTRYGNTGDGRILEFSSDSGSQLISFQHSMVREWVAGRICGGRPAIRAALDDGSVVEVVYAGGEWKDKVVLPPASGFQPSNHRVKGHLGSLYPLKLKDGRSIQILVNPGIDVPFRTCTAPDPQMGLYEILARGDVRGDGQVRFYGIVHPFKKFTSSRINNGTEYHPIEVPGEEKTARIFELEADSARAWSVRFLSEPGPFNPEFVAIGDGRNDGVQRLYGARYPGIMEFSWKDGRWNSNIIGRTWSQTGIVIGRFRDDEVSRVYSGNLATLVELTYSDRGWRGDSFEHGRGQMGMLSTWARRRGTPAQLVFSSTDRGIHEFHWSGRGRMAVAPFAAEGAGQEVANGFSNLLRLELVDRGNCDVLERERMDAILKEKSMPWTSVSSGDEAARIGRLLGAEIVVTGSVVEAFGEHVASVNLVSVQTGILRRGRQHRWRYDQEMETAVAAAAAEVCPIQEPAARNP